MKKILGLLFIVNAFVVYGQKSITAVEIKDSEGFKIDGILNETQWLEAMPANGLVELEPNPGKNSRQDSEIKILYDDRGLYIGVRNYDSAPDSILTELSQRDNFGNVDWVGLVIDPYQAGLNGFGFYLTAAGVQCDAKYNPDEDWSWNAVWNSGVKIDEAGWTAEYFIPFSSLRFPKKDVQEWGFNLIRLLRRTRQKSTWNEVKPDVNGFLIQAGKLEGIENIETPVRLQLFPYVSAYADVYDGNTTTLYNGGMDLKYGINDAFTLDMTLVPDFGQAQSINRVLNLSPFEVRYNENRQFFTEGTELFNKGGLFYSRRVGSTPIARSSVNDKLHDNESIEENPDRTKLMNASKVSGRTKGGLGIGVFNAITNETHALVYDSITDSKRKVLTDPYTNYSVFVLDQNLKNNSSITFVNTNVFRNGGDFYDANVAALMGNIKNKERTYGFDFYGAYNKKSGYSGTDADGFANWFQFAKISGNFTFSTSINIESDTYDPNDLGFLFNNNEISKDLNLGYTTFEPKWGFNRIWSNFYIVQRTLFKPQAFNEFAMNLNGGVFTKNFHALGYNIDLRPVENRDYFDPRTGGFDYYYRIPASYRAGIWVSSDYRKMFALDGDIYHRAYNSNRYDFTYRIAPRVRVNNHLLLVYSYRYNIDKNSEGYALSNGLGRSEMELDPDYDANNIYYAKRDVTTHTNLLTAEYKINPIMFTTFRLRHYWSKVINHSFYDLNREGGLDDVAYDGVNDAGASYHDNDFNAFNIDMVYSWVFVPGSRLDVVWKSQLFKSSDAPEKDFFNNLNALNGEPAYNSFSVKLLYFIDYNDTCRYFKNKIG